MLVYGKNVVTELLNKGEKIHKAIIYKEFSDQLIINALQNKKISIEYVDKRRLDELANGNHQGIIVSIADYEYCELEELINDNSFIVMLDHLEDTHNFGAIIRTAEAAGVTGIVIPKDRSVEVNSTVMKTSAGALNNMKIAQVTNLTNTLKQLKKAGFWIIGTDMEGTTYSELDYKGKIVVVLGSESNGLSRLVKEECDFIATIPMQGSINSLNASVAAGIIIFEATKTRK